jgi:hypothetical protein
VSAEEFTVLRVCDELDEPAGVAEALGLAIGRERELRECS